MAISCKVVRIRDISKFKTKTKPTKFSVSLWGDCLTDYLWTNIFVCILLSMEDENGNFGHLTSEKILSDSGRWMIMERGLVLSIKGRVVLLDSICWGTCPLNHWVADNLEKIEICQARLRLSQNYFSIERREDRRTFSMMLIDNTT